MREFRHLQIDRTAIADADEEQAVVGIVSIRHGSEGDILATMGSRGRFEPQHFAAGPGEPVARRLGRVPFRQDPVKGRCAQVRDDDLLIPRLVDGGCARSDLGVRRVKKSIAHEVGVKREAAQARGNPRIEDEGGKLAADVEKHFGRPVLHAVDHAHLITDEHRTVLPGTGPQCGDALVGAAIRRERDLRPLFQFDHERGFLHGRDQPDLFSGRRRELDGEGRELGFLRLAVEVG